MNKFIIILLLLTNIIILSGCVEQNILERTSITTLVGYDLDENNEINTTAVIRQINPDLESKVEIQSSTAETSRGARVKTELKTSKKIGSGQLRVVLFGDELAKAGLNNAIHSLKMNPEISNGIHLAVVEGDTKSLIENNYKNITDIGQHIFQLIEHNTDQQHILSSTLHEINRDNLSKITSFSLPLLKKEGDYVEITGTAFFKYGKMVGSLPIEDTLYFKMIRQNFQDGFLELALPTETFDNDSQNSSDEIHIAIDSINSKRETKVIDKTIPEFDITFNFECRLIETPSNININSLELEGKMEEAINKKIESEINRIIEYSKELNSDIFRFGEIYKAQVRNTNIDSQKWDEMYPQMKVNIKVNSQILRDGVFQ